MNPEDGVERHSNFVPPHHRDAFRETLAQRNSPGIIDQRSDMIDIGPLNSSKAPFPELCQRYHIGQDDLTVGDWRMIPMFKTTPHSYRIDLAETAGNPERFAQRRFRAGTDR